MRLNNLKTIGLLVLLLVFLIGSEASEKQSQQTRQNTERKENQLADGTQQKITTQARQRSSTPAIIIYDEQPAQGVRYWNPNGWMPDGGGISFNDSYEGDKNLKPNTGKTCIKFGFYASQRDFVGIYWLWEGWNPQNPAPNVFQLLNVKRGARIRLKLFARGQSGGENVQFKVGGVSQGKFPDSLTPVVETSYNRLTNQWQPYTIDLTNKDLTNLVGGFCVVLNTTNNPNRNEVWFYLDDIGIETF